MIWLIGGVERETKSNQVGIGRLYSSKNQTHYDIFTKILVLE